MYYSEKDETQDEICTIAPVHSRDFTDIQISYLAHFFAVQITKII